MHQYKPDDHLVSTSFWHSFPKNEFWTRPEYSAVDFADIHQYIPQDNELFDDTALASYASSMKYGAKREGGAGKPVIRGEVGFTTSGSERPTDQFIRDTKGIWLHNFLWAGINPGGLIESYWNEDYHIYRQVNGSYQFDHRNQFGAYFNFIKDVPLSNGNYQDAGASVSDANTRAWGQKDLVNGRAHLWIQNKLHTWEADASGTKIPALTGSISLSGFKPGARYVLEWWSTYPSDPATQVLRQGILTARIDGSLVFSVVGITSDIAVKIAQAGQ
jgi:hypothetical protein